MRLAISSVALFLAACGGSSTQAEAPMVAAPAASSRDSTATSPESASESAGTDHSTSAQPNSSGEPAQSVEPPPPTGHDTDVQTGIPGAPATTEPRIVSHSALRGNRTVGQTIILPDADDRATMLRSGASRVVAVFKLCLDRDGAPTLHKLLKSSGYPSYDNKLKAGIAGWRYSPFEVDGQPVPVCTSVSFIFDVPK